MNHYDTELPKRRSSARGLPSADARRELAKTYLSLQHEHWPALVTRGILPAMTDENFGTLAEQLCETYMSAVLADLPRSLSGLTLGACYVRYSDENSNVRSLDQQLRNILLFAAGQTVFIPWQQVFCDAAISGRTQDRPGFQLLGAAVEYEERRFTTVYVDDLSRLSRDQVDSMAFGKNAKFHNRTLIGVSDGFNADDMMSDLTHTIHSMRHKMFSADLSAKVIRGERDKFLQGGNPGAVPTGYKPVPRLDADGAVVVVRNKVKTDVVIDEPAAAVVREIFKRFAIDHQSPHRIAKHLNDCLALDRNRWNESSIRQMLHNERYRGKITWRKFETVHHPKTGKKHRKRRPEEEWLVRQDETMRIISEDLWEATCRRRKEVSRNTRGKGNANRSRQSDYPTRLFDLYCKDCDRPLRLTRSGEKTASLHCDSGKYERHGCTLRSTKMVHIIEECVLARIKEELLTPELFDTLFVKANQYLADEAAKPKTDTAKLERQINVLNKSLERLAKQLGKFDDGPMLKKLLAEVEQTELQLVALTEEKEQAASENFRPKKMSKKDFLGMVTALRDLLQDDVGASASALAKALGRIPVTQGPKRGRSKSWLLDLSINPIPVLLEVAQIKDIATNPTTLALEYLYARSWTIAPTVKCQAFEIKTEHRVAKRAGELAAKGCSINTIKDKLNVDWKVAKAAVQFAEDHPEDAQRYARPHTGPDKNNTLVQSLGPQVLQLRRDGVPFKKIATELNVSLGTVTAAFDHASPAAIEQAAETGKPVDRGSIPLLAPEKRAAVRERLACGETERAIKAACQVDRGTIRKIKREMRAPEPS